MSLETPLIIALRQKQKKEKNSRRYVKITVVLMTEIGFSVAHIAAALGIDDNTVYRYNAAFSNADSLDDYLQDHYVACKANLDAEQLQELVEALTHSLYTSAEHVGAWIKQQFGFEYTGSGVRHLLKRVGFVFKRSKLIPYKQDLPAQRAFIEEITPLLESAPPDTVLLYSDAVHPQHNTETTQGWIAKGKEFFVRSTSGKKRLNLLGVLNAHTPTDLFVSDYETINGASVIAFYQQVEQRYPDATSIVIVADNARYYHSEAVKAYLATSRIQIKRLPPYSPNLNLIERAWRYLKKEVTRSHVYASFKLFRDAIFAFFADLKSHEVQLKALLTLNFRTGV